MRKIDRDKGRVVFSLQPTEKITQNQDDIVSGQIRSLKQINVYRILQHCIAGVILQRKADSIIFFFHF